MRGTTTRDATHNFTAPQNWNEERDGACTDLSVRVAEWGPGKLLEHVSTWKPSGADLIHMLHGGVIELSLLGAQCPVLLTVVDPVESADIAGRGGKTTTINEDGHGLGYDEHGPSTPA